MCQPHWDRLRELIRERGMEHLVAQSGQAAADALKRELDGAPLRETFDPLMQANNMIMARALEQGGLYLMGTKPDGTQYCPICEAVQHTKPDPAFPSVEEHYTVGAIDAVLEHARELGLMPRPA